MFGFVGRMFGNGASAGPKGTGKRRGRGPTKSAKEQSARRRLRFMAELEEKDPARYHDLMLRECGLGGDDGRTDMAQVMKVIEYLKQIGLKVVPSKGGTDLDDDSLRSWIKDLAPMVAPMLANAMAGRQPTQPEPTPEPPTYRVVSPERPAALPHAQPTQPEAKPTMSLISKFLVGQLDGKSPTEAATWIVSQPQFNPLVERLKDTPDAQLLPLFADLADQSPDYAGFVAWLKARPDWTIQTVHEIQAQSGGGSAPTTGAGAMGI